ncbi:MAG TPA: SgcJ/EcaC family oxidoreductase [Fimbriiglobus sp.]|nr:SgcJ/EcaC family oxidoreductase [Fimbriiglobus sp.]
MKETIAGYTAAFNKGDVAAVAAFWAEDAEYHSDDGTVARGRAAVADRFKSLFADKRGLTLAVTPTAVKVLGPSVALVEGTAKVTDPKAGADESPFESVWVKGADGQWRLGRLRDLSAQSDRETNLGAVTDCGGQAMLPQ